jgi:hypothetical protein
MMRRCAFRHPGKIGGLTGFMRTVEQGTGHQAGQYIKSSDRDRINLRILQNSFDHWCSGSRFNKRIYVVR